MKFEGTGLIYGPKEKKMIINFKNTPVVETDDEYTIGLLEKAPTVKCIDASRSTKEEKKTPTKKELVAEAKEAGVTGADRMSKEALLEALGE